MLRTLKILQITFLTCEDALGKNTFLTIVLKNYYPKYGYNLIIKCVLSYLLKFYNAYTLKERFIPCKKSKYRM